jgi:hypothetical protein
VEEYAFTTGCKLIAATQPGEKYQAPDGSWMTRGAGRPCVTVVAPPRARSIWGVFALPLLPIWFRFGRFGEGVAAKAHT